MSGVIIYLVLMLPPGSSDLPESRRATVCFLFGLASDGVYTAFSVTRQAVVSYTAFSPLPLRAVIFCCTFLGVTSTGRYPASCPMKPGLSSPAQRAAAIICSAQSSVYYAMFCMKIQAKVLCLRLIHVPVPHAPLAKTSFLYVKATAADKFTHKRIVVDILTRHRQEVIEEF